jgi:uncharacterized protein YqjF (DUF2071 family)
MKQGWYDLVYVHFEYSPEVVQALLPAGLQVDTFEDKAWVGLIPFSMRGIGIPRLPSIPYLGSFPEVNVRTYVTRNGVPGVWFFSLDPYRICVKEMMCIQPYVVVGHDDLTARRQREHRFTYTLVNTSRHLVSSMFL